MHATNGPSDPDQRERALGESVVADPIGRGLVEHLVEDRDARRAILDGIGEEEWGEREARWHSGGRSELFPRLFRSLEPERAAERAIDAVMKTSADDPLGWRNALVELAARPDTRPIVRAGLERVMAENRFGFPRDVGDAVVLCGADCSSLFPDDPFTALREKWERNSALVEELIAEGAVDDPDRLRASVRPDTPSLSIFQLAGLGVGVYLDVETEDRGDPLRYDERLLEPLAELTPFEWTVSRERARKDRTKYSIEVRDGEARAATTFTHRDDSYDLRSVLALLNELRKAAGDARRYVSVDHEYGPFVMLGEPATVARRLNRALSPYETGVVTPSESLARLGGVEAPDHAGLLVTGWPPEPPRGPYECVACAVVAEAEAALDGGDAAGALARWSGSIADVHLYRTEDGQFFELNEADLRLRICRARALLVLDRHDEAHAEAYLALRQLNRRAVRWLDEHPRWWIDVIETLGTIIARRENIHSTLARFRACEVAEGVPAGPAYDGGARAAPPTRTAAPRVQVVPLVGEVTERRGRHGHVCFVLEHGGVELSFERLQDAAIVAKMRDELDAYARDVASRAASKLIDGWNESWRQEGEAELSASGLASRFRLRSIYVYAGGDADMWLHDGGAFGGQPITISIEDGERGEADGEWDEEDGEWDEEDGEWDEEDVSG